MKKIKFLFIFVISIFLGIGCVEAKDFVGFGKCTYVPLWGGDELKDSINPTGEKNEYSYYFTDLIIRPKDDGANVTNDRIFEMFHVDEDTQDYYFENISYSIKFSDDLTYSLETNDTYNSTFKSVFEKEGKCPTNLIYKNTGETWGGTNLTPIFTSEDIAIDCESNTEATDVCPIVLKNTSSDIKMVNNEDMWTYSTSGNNSCNKTTVNISIDEDGYLKAKLIVARDSEWYEKTSKSDINVFVKTTGNTVVQMQEIWHLLYKNNFKTAFYRTDKDNEKFYVSSITYSNNSCNLNSDYDFTKDYTCAKKTEFDSLWNMWEININNMHPDISSTYNALTMYVSQTGKVAKTYDNETDINKILEDVKLAEQAIASDADQYNREDVLTSALENMKDGTHPQLDGETPCQDVKDEVNRLINLIQTKSQKYANDMDTINQALENAAKRAREIEATNEQLQQIQDAIDDSQVIVDRVITLVERTKRSLLDDVNLRLEGLSSSGCGVISRELKEFLNLVLWYIRIAGVVLAIILSLLDYVKAASGSDDKSMEAANKRFMTRVILVAALFLIPVLLEFVLETLNISTTAGSIACLD